MITASVVLFHTPQKLIDTIIRSYQPSAERLLFFVDNTPGVEKSRQFTPVSEYTNHTAIHDNPNENSQLQTKGFDDLVQVFEYYSREILSYIYIYRTGSNLGYGSAHNIAIHEAIRLHSEFQIVLNPDLSFEPSVINSLADYARKHSDVVYMLPEVVNQNGEVQHLCKLLPTPSDLIFRRFFPWLPGSEKKNNRYVLANSGYDHIMNPPCLSGCFMFMRVSTLEKYNLFFDERFFMYCEDFDLMRRLHRVGKTIYYPYVQITHAHERSSYHSFKMMCHHISSAVKYFNKYGWWKDKERNKMNSEVFN